MPLPTRSDRRRALLEQRRRTKMARSAHAYVRGSTAKFYEWLASPAGTSLPAGPSIWICGDCHVSNLGPIASTAKRVDVQIRDLDQTVIGNPSHDLVRLALSLVMAARGSDLSGVISAQMIEQLVDGYAHALVTPHAHPERIAEVPRSLTFESAMKRSWQELLAERLGDLRPALPLGKRFWPLTKSERHDIETLGKTRELRRLITRLAGREDDAEIAVVDAAFWVKGCSSLGLFRAAVLVDVGGKKLKPKHGGLSLLDVKEATAPAAPRDAPGVPRHHGARVVAGARHLAPFLGERMLATTIADHPVFVRELLPQDLKVEANALDADEARALARYLGAVVGRAHGRQLDAATARAWKRELERRRSKLLDAPTWLWSAVVELVQLHEGAYLEHCRRFALPARFSASGQRRNRRSGRNAIAK